MKWLSRIVIVSITMFQFIVLSAQDSVGQQKVNDIQQHSIERTDERVDRNAKALTLLMTAVPALGAVIVALFIYIKKLHSGTLKLTEKCIEAISKMGATNEKLSISIDTSGEKISSAFSENKTTIAMALTDNRRAIDELKSFIMLNAQHK